MSLLNTDGVGTGVRGMLVDLNIVVLGPVELRVSGRRELHGTAKEVQMLAALALDVGKAVSLDSLSRRLWDDAPPSKPQASLHSYATRIRRRIGTERLTQQAHAYTLDLPPYTVDYHRFERLTLQAQSLASSGDTMQALTLLQNAGSLWRGRPLAGFTGLWAERVRHRLADRRLAATLLRAGIELRMGHFTGLMGELRVLVDQYPGDETVMQYFMAAAYGSGRQSEALRAYESLRRRLRQLRTEPGEALARVYRGILDGAPATELIAGGTPSGASLPAPQNLPAHSKVMFGRSEHLRTLRTAGAGVIAFQAISGMAGVGKTLLALHAARDLAHQYPDGQVHINLRAHSGQRPLTPEAALTTLLRDFGIPAKAIPHDVDGLITLWRTVLANRQAIIVLDDAADAAQVQPLLPGDSPSLVLITSRRRLTGIPGVHNVFVDVLAPADAEALFTTLAHIPPGQENGDVAELARLCGCLPLALALAAGRLRSRPTWTVGRLVQRMSQEPDRLSEIRDGQWEITSVFAFSYTTLSTEEQRVFRLISLHYTPVFDPHTTAALVGLPIAATERILESLLDVHLLQEPAADRYEFHDLIAAYARSLALGDPVDMREQALDRLDTFYLHAVTAVDRLLRPRRPRNVETPTPSSVTLPDWPGPQRAKDWLLSEAAAVVTAEAHFRERGRQHRAAQLAQAAAGFHDSEGLWTASETMHIHAVRHWRSAGDRSAEADGLLALAEIQSQTGRYEQAEDSCRGALAAARAVADTAAEAGALRSLGLVHWNLGRLKEFRMFLQEALAIHERSGDEWNIARCQNNLGISLLQLGEHARAMEYFAAALDGFVRTGDRRGEAQALNNLSDLHLHMGQDGQARAALDRALALLTEVGSRAEKAIAQLNLANTLKSPTDLERALSLHRQALATFRHIGDKRNETVTLNAIGAAFLAAGQFAEASAHHAVALTLARDIGATQEEAQALRGLGTAEFRSGQVESAAGQLNEALSLARRISSSEEEARAHTALGDLHLDAGHRDEALFHFRSAHAKFQDLNELESAHMLDRIRKLTEGGFKGAR
jgi:tetratricopeptide (TPR) repeat protein/DNA-binding SARP family transcriptional activator